MRTLAVLAFFSLSLAASAATYSFSLNPAGNTFNGNVSISAVTDGSLLGDFDAATNPTGTRTKPGLFGTFGAQENVAVPVTLTPALDGPLGSTPTGGFFLEINTTPGTVNLSGLTLDLLASGPVSIPSSITLLYDSFRTRTPDSLFIGGFPLAIPVGANQLTSLAAAQIGASSAGTLTVAGSGLYDFSIGTVLMVSGGFDSTLGATALPPLPVPFTFEGQIDLTGPSPVLIASSTFTFQNTTAPALALPPVPFALPTILPAGNTANLVFNLTLSSVDADLGGTLALTATGTPVPEPTTLAFFAVGAFGVLCGKRARQP